MSATRINRCLISVSDKSELVSLGSALQDLGVTLMASGGTHARLLEAGISVQEIAEYTGFPEMMDGRVKTLHPLIHGGILGRRHGEVTDSEVMAAHGIEPIDLVVVNLYPFERTVSADDCTVAEAIENIDIGGPTMVRSAAKNFRSVAVVVDPADYQAIIDELRAQDGCLGDDTRFRLAVKAFQRIAAYDAAISNYLGSLEDFESGARKRFPGSLTLHYVKSRDMRYGENPHQQAALYIDPTADDLTAPALADAKQGKAMSFNNLADADAAVECVRGFEQPACVIVKHANPCGVAVAEHSLEAYRRAFACDTESAFGGIIAFNRELDADTIEAIIENQFVEVIIAPGFTAAAQTEIRRRKNVRVLATGAFTALQSGLRPGEYHLKQVTGGILVQDPDRILLVDDQLKVVSNRKPDAQEMKDLVFGWQVAQFVKSNAIVYAAGMRTIGIGAGQMSRVNSARIATFKAKDQGLALEGAIMASDAFIPFRDGIDAAAEAGIRAVIQPGGSVRDQEVIDAVNEHDMAMVFTGIRHFRH